MTPLTSILTSLAEREFRPIAKKFAEPMSYEECKEAKGFSEGARWQFSADQQIIGRLVQALEDALHTIALRKHHDDDCQDATEKFKPEEMCECGASVAQDANKRILEILTEGTDR